MYLCFGDHRDLHSFPTRRSSDLLTTAEAANLVVHGSKTGDATAYPYNADAKGFALVDLTLHWVSERGPDRKSTRLNSSHRCISYAVFCLKKKKINDNYVLRITRR